MGKTILTEEQKNKYEELQRVIRGCGSLAVAFSGGTDSALLVKTAHDILGDRMAAVIAESVIMSVREQCEAETFCETEHIRMEIIRPDAPYTRQFRANPIDRCYFCKKDLMGKIVAVAKKNGLAFTADGTNADDGKAFRPGMRAVSELGILSPLKEAGLTKEDIRAISKYLGLPTWNKPSSACLATRFAYGDTITTERLKMVEKAEDFLRTYGFAQSRVRILKGPDGAETARIELDPMDFSLMMQENMRKKTTNTFRQIGFTYVALDLMGFRSGSMDEALHGHEETSGTGEKR